MTRRNHRRALLAALVAGSLALAGCSGTADAGGTDEPTVLRWAASLPAGWDPVVTTSISASYYQSLVYEPLVRIDENYQPVPALAESWDYNDAGDAITFHLREGGVFSDGEALDAAAVKAYFDRAKTSSTSNRIEDYRSIESVTVDGEYDVTLHLASPDYQIPLLLGTKGALITPPDVDPESLDTDPIGAGPFTVTEFVPDDHIYLEKNPDYWAADDIHIDRVELTPAPEGSTVVSALQTGVYDFASIPTVNLGDAAKADGVEAFDPGGAKTSYIDLNTNIAPFDDPAVVEAVHHAIDRQELFDKVSYGYGDIAGEPFLEGSPGYVASVDQSGEYDPAESEKILADAGYAPGSLSVDIVVEKNSPASEIVQSQLKAVGIEATITVDPSYRERLFVKKDIGITLFGGHNFDSDVQTLSTFFGADGRLNLSGYEPAGFSDALDAVRSTPLDDPDYESLLQNATEIGLQARQHIFYQTYVIAFAKSSRVSDLPTVPNEVSWIGVTIDPQ